MEKSFYFVILYYNYLLELIYLILILRILFGFLNKINKPIIKYDVRPIQLISLLFLSKKNTSDMNSKAKGIFLQINTGEGKSLIIQFFAAYLALQGKKVDIITSNSVLAD